MLRSDERTLSYAEAEAEVQRSAHWLVHSHGLVPGHRVLLRALVFGFAAERACQHLEAPQQQALAQLLEQMDQAHAAQDATAYYEANLQFHAQILTLGGNQRAHQTYDDCVKSLHLFRRSHFNAPGNMKRSNAEHRAIFEAIAKGDARRARTLAERHVLSGRDRVLARLEP